VGQCSGELKNLHFNPDITQQIIDVDRSVDSVYIARDLRDMNYLIDTQNRYYVNIASTNCHEGASRSDPSTPLLGIECLYSAANTELFAEFRVTYSPPAPTMEAINAASQFKIQIITDDITGDGQVGIMDFFTSIQKFGQTVSVHGMKVKVNAAYISSIISNLGKKVK
jgi:hypothetical protein